MLSWLSKSFFWRGVLAAAVGIIAIVWPGIALSVVAALFVVAVFASAVDQAMRAFSSGTAGPVVGHLLLAVVDVAAGVVTLAWPGLTVEALTIWIGVWAVVAGAFEFGLVFMEGETAGERLLNGFSGLLAVVLGVVLLARPDIGAVSLAQAFGFYSLVLGTWSLVLAATSHTTGARVDKVLGSHA